MTKSIRAVGGNLTAGQQAAFYYARKRRRARMDAASSPPVDPTEVDITAALALGLSESAVVYEELDLTATFDVGLTGYALVGNELSFDAAFTFGFGEAAAVLLQQNLAASFGLGLSEAAAPSLERDLTATLGLGLSEAAQISFESDLAASVALGLSEAASTFREVNIAASAGMGMSEAAAVSIQRNLTASLGMGFSEAATAQATTVITKSFLGASDASPSVNAGVSWTGTFTAFAIGAASASRWILIVGGPLNLSGATLTGCTVGGTSLTRIVTPPAGQSYTFFLGKVGVGEGTSANIVLSGVDGGADPNSIGMAAWYLTNVFDSGNPLDAVVSENGVLNSGNAIASPINFSLTSVDGGAAFFAVRGNTATGSNRYTWTIPNFGLEDSDYTSGGGNFGCASVLTVGTSQTASVSFASGTPRIGCSVALKPIP